VASDEPAAPVVDPAPFDLPGRGRAAALCLHGLTGTPYEVRPLGEELARRGVRAVGPALPGHNASVSVLAGIPHGAWLEAARSQLQALRRDHERVFAVGLSMGGLLTLAMAAEERLDAAVVVGTPLRFGRTLRWLLPLLARIHPLPRKRGGSDIRDPAARRQHPGYDVMPLGSVLELMRLQRRVARSLPGIRTPLLVAHGAHDATAKPTDAREIQRSVGSEVAELLILESSAHVVPVDRDGPRLARATGEFVSRYL
jgi:carboxylesterase